jgi:hypothetical protein
MAKVHCICRMLVFKIFFAKFMMRPRVKIANKYFSFSFFYDCAIQYRNLRTQLQYLQLEPPSLQLGKFSHTVAFF